MKSAAVTCLIIGGGISGLSTAYALLKKRPHWRVTILEQGAQAGHGASWANGAMIHPSQAWPWLESGIDPKGSQNIAQQTFQLAARSSEVLRAHFKTFDLPHRHRKSGCLKVFQNRAALEGELEHYERLAALGLRYNILSPAGFAREAGLPQPYGYAALHFPDDHSGPARLYCAALIKAIEDMGGVIRCGQQVTHIDGKGAQTQDAVHAADQYIICSGYSAAQLLGREDIKGLKGYSRTYHALGLGGALPPVPVMDDAHHFALTPLGDHLRVSGGAHGVDEEPSDIFDRFEDFAFTILPHLKTQLSAARYSDWSAIRPMSESGPIIGYDDAHGLWVNTGHGHMGWTLSAGAAQALVDLICA